MSKGITISLISTNEEFLKQDICGFIYVTIVLGLRLEFFAVPSMCGLIGREVHLLERQVRKHEFFKFVFCGGFRTEVTRDAHRLIKFVFVAWARPLVCL